MVGFRIIIWYSILSYWKMDVSHGLYLRANCCSLAKTDSFETCSVSNELNDLHDERKRNKSFTASNLYDLRYVFITWASGELRTPLSWTSLITVYRNDNECKMYFYHMKIIINEQTCKQGLLTSIVLLHFAMHRLQGMMYLPTL